jgi:group I intron endonuclease
MRLCTEVIAESRESQAEPESLECAIAERLPVAFKGPGVYGIRHSSSGRIYVGIAKDIRSRVCQHLGALLAGKHHSRYLQNAWNKYGQAAFTVILLERNPEFLTVGEARNKREQFWMDHFDSFKTGFNARPKAESMIGHKWSDAQNEARKRSNKEAWADESLRAKLSVKFKGYRRGKWTSASHAKVSDTLKQRHAENPEWRQNAQKWLHSPENEARRIASMRRALQRPEVRAARVQQMRRASESPKKVIAIRETYFKKFNRESLGFKSPEEVDQACLRLYREGKSCRSIGRFLDMDHKGVTSRLRRLGVSPERGRRSVGH